MVRVSRVTLLLEVFSGVQKRLLVHELIFLFLMILCFIDKNSAQFLQSHFVNEANTLLRSPRFASNVCSRKPQGVSSSKLSGSNGFYIEIEGFPKKYVPGQTYEVSILGRPLEGASALQKFTGFTLTAESSDYNKLNPDVGSFKLTGDSLTTFSEDCPNSVTATSAVQKTRATVKWLAPASGSGCVIFRASVVEDQGRWYADDDELSREICQDYENTDDQDAILDKCCACEEAKYEVAFEGLWSRYTHPKSYPQNEWDVRFSNITGASHSGTYKIWEYGGYASEGVQHLAETGLTKELETELKKESDRIRTVIKAQGLVYPNLKMKTFAVFRVDRKSHVVSLLSRMNPSPDWLVGVSSLELCLSNCSWLTEKVINLYPWDAGTREGNTYYPESVEPSEPHQRIRKITSSFPPDPDSPFFDETGTPMKPVARLTLSRQRLYEKSCDADDTSHSKAAYDDPRPECATFEWTTFSPCNSECVRVRTRAYQRRERLQDCRSQLVDRVPCTDCGRHTNMCETTEWTPWGECNVTCGRGYRLRSRRFKNKMAHKVCSAETQQKIRCTADTEDCSVVSVPSECAVTAWSDWSPCTEPCGEGTKARTRSYIDERLAKLYECRAMTVQQAQCIGTDCGTVDVNERCRLPKNEGRPCRGQFQRYFYNAEEGKCLHFIYTGCNGNSNNFKTYEECEQECQTDSTEEGKYDPKRDTGSSPVDCRVTKWSEWGPCSHTCGVSRRERFRTIVTPASNSGRPCPAKLRQLRRCKETRPCPVDCQLGDWSSWGQCSKSCGSAFKERHRSVKKHPRHGGAQCASTYEKAYCERLPPCRPQ